MIPERKWAAFFLLISAAAFSQQPSAGTQTVNPVIIVTGTFEPIPLSEANRSVVSLASENQLLYSSIVDYLQLDPSIDLEQRGPGGVQADLSIRGASFEQSLVLINGLRINDAQTGHHDMDIPVPMDALSRIEILHGAGSALYGADAMGGAVNFITGPPSRTELRARAGVGNFGFNQQHLGVGYVGHWFSEQVSAGRDFSTGFIPDRDYRSSAASSETLFSTRLGTTDILLAGSDRPFGAAQFYGNFNSWERTKGWFLGAWQDLGPDTQLQFGYRRHSDEFVLVRNDPALYENNHVSESWQMAIRRRSSAGKTRKVSYGLDANGDAIDSNNLGHHARTRGAGYVDLDLQWFHRLFLSIGAREEIFSGGRTQFAPTVAGGMWIRDGLRFRASVSRAFRLPTYTDLYYSDPDNIGNPLLKPESGWDFEGGPEWNPGGHVSAELTVFNRREQNDIDYVRSSSASPWQATNIGYISFTGIETTGRIRLPRSQELGLAYTALWANQGLQPGTTSKYVFNYPSHNGIVSWTGGLKNFVTARTRLGVTQRVGQREYAIWDLAASRTHGTVRPYLQFSNLTSTRYQEIPGVGMPGRSIVGGIEIVIAARRAILSANH